MVNTAQTREARPEPAERGVAPRRRLDARARERQIVEGATDFFARRGLDAQMRELASELGIAHTLLYHYFPSKRQLIERVYEESIAGRWNPQWETLLDEPQRSVQHKLHDFYRAYLGAILTPEWLRILVHSGLSDSLIPNRYFALLRARLFPRLLRELRRHAGSRSRAPATPREEALLMGFHGGLIYHLGIWPLIYQQTFNGADEPTMIDTFVADRIKGLLMQAALFVPASTSRRAAPKAGTD